MIDRLLNLMWATQALAQRAEVQLSLFPDFVCKADELALDFSNWHDCTIAHNEPQLTKPQRSSLSRLNDKLDSMSGPKPHWTDDALRTDPAWREVRALATEILVAFGWKDDVPPTDRSIYVSSG